MRILILSDLSSYHTYLFAETLSEQGHEVHVASLEEPIMKTSGFVIHRVRPLTEKRNFKRYIPAIPQFLRIYRSTSPDVVSAHFIPNYGLIARFLPGKKVLSVWGSDLLVVPRKSPLHQRATGWIVRRFDRVHVDANFMKSILERDYRVGPDKIRVFPFGLKKEDRELEIPEKNELIFVTHRRLDRDMDPMTIVRAFKELRKSHSAKLIMMSSGALAGEIKNFIEREKIEGIELTGRVSRETIIANLLESRFYVSASLTDSTSVSLLEAMAAGCFPIVTDIPGNREWIKHGRNGLLFKPHDAKSLSWAMLEAIDNPRIVGEGVRFNKRLVMKRANFEENLRSFFEDL